MKARPQSSLCTRSALLPPDKGASDLQTLSGLLAFSGTSEPAARLLRDYPSLGHVLAADAEQLRAYGLTANDLALFSLVRAACLLQARAQIRGRPALSNWSAVIGYLQASMAYDQIEQFRILFLDRKNNLIIDEVQQRGTVGHTPVYPREVVRRALVLNASSLIVVHNHPSGDPTPSIEDIAMTRGVKTAAEALGIHLHDHVIVGHGRVASLRSLGHL